MPSSNAPNTPMARLIAQLTRLPGIGKRSAERIAFDLLKEPAEVGIALADAIRDLKENTLQCSVCFNLAERDPCGICGDDRRDLTKVLVVEQPHDVATLESTGQYDGVYHVLMGRLSPLDGVGPSELTIAALLDRAEAGEVGEVILGTSPTIEGDGTAMYLAERLEKLGRGGRDIKVTRLARGLPTGVNLEVVSKAVLGDAITGRHELGG